MIYCTNCGKELPVDSKFCPSCGTTIPVVVNRTDENLRTEPVRTQAVVTEPVRTERIASHHTDVNRDFTTRKSFNEFYKDPGFWGSLLVLAGFFLPFFNKDGNSLFETVQNSAASEPAVYMWLIFPVTALLVLLHSLVAGWPGFISTIFIIAALFALGLLVYIIMNDPAKYFGSADISTILKTAGIGLWLTLFGTILLLFHSKKRRVEVHRTKYVDRTV